METCNQLHKKMERERKEKIPTFIDGENKRRKKAEWTGNVDFFDFFLI